MRATRAFISGTLGWMTDESCVSVSMAGKRSSRARPGRGTGVDRAIGELAERQYGVVARAQLRALGISVSAIEGRIERGQLTSLHTGVYAVGHRALRREGRLFGAVIACGPDAVLSHRSAANVWGLLPAPPPLPEVTRPRSNRRRTGIVVHRSALPPDEVTVVDGIPVTSPFRTLFDVAGTVRKRELERAMNEAEVRRLTDRLSLRDLLARYPGKRGSKVMRDLLGAREPVGITQSHLEELFVSFLDSYRLPRPRFNATLPLRTRFLRPDCMWVEQRLIVELDGRAAHGTARAFEADRRRDRELLAEGWRSARVTWRQLREEPAALAADLSRMLAHAPGSVPAPPGGVG